MTETPQISPARAGGLVTYRFGGREYPLQTVPNCLTCVSPYRFEIEEAIVAGRTYRKIEEMTVGFGTDYRISFEAIRGHYVNGHMPLDLSATRSVIETRARKVGKRIEDDTASLVDGMTLLETVVTKTFEGIAKGKIEPGVRDGLRAAKMLADLGEYDGAQVDQQAYVEAFMVYQEEAEKIMGKEAFEKFGDALAANPVLAALAARYEGETVEGDVVEEPESQG